MADLLRGLFGGPAQPSAPAHAGDADFAEFAAAPSPEAAASPVTASSPADKTPAPFGSLPFNQRPFTKWYNVHERVTWSDFTAELYILPFLALLLVAHIWGVRRNRSKAKAWIAAHAPALATEFAVVGFGGGKRLPSADEVASQGLAKASENLNLMEPEALLKERSKDLYLSYATGRQNIAFVDVKLQLIKAYNPLAVMVEQVTGFFFETYPPSVDKAEVVAYPFDGRENDVIPRIPGTEIDVKSKSGFEGFVWAVVHKDSMRTLRDERYDLSLTITKENAKLPDWATVMSESAEITDLLLSNELAAAIKDFGEDFISLIITDMPSDAPKTLNELVPKKRLILTTKLSATSSQASTASTTLLTTFLRLTDTLAATKFRPEVTRRVKATRDAEAAKIRRTDEQEKADTRKTAADKAKKDEREKKLKGMSAEEQRRYLEKEREREQRKGTAKRSVKA